MGLPTYVHMHQFCIYAKNFAEMLTYMSKFLQKYNAPSKASNSSWRPMTVCVTTTSLTAQNSHGLLHSFCD